MPANELSFSPNAVQLRDVRAKVREIAADLGADPSVCDNLALVADELVNNAIEHGVSYRKEGRDLRVSLARDGDEMVIRFFDSEMPSDEVTELAERLAATANGMPELESERGRGLFLLSIYLEGLRAALAEQGGLILSGRIRRE